jgi:hypothetical protein
LGTQSNLPDLNGSSFFYSFVGREAMDSADMEDLDRQRRADLMRDTIMDKLAETGEKDKLKDMLRDRLILSGEIHVKKRVNLKSGTPFVGTFYDHGEHGELMYCHYFII